MSKKLFGTDGVRGVANKHPMTTEVAMQLGRAAAYVFKHADRRSRIVIGCRFTRILTHEECEKLRTEAPFFSLP